MGRRSRRVIGALALCAGPVFAQDFDGDGVTDLAYGVPGEDVGAIVDCGAVMVIYGAGLGLGLDALGSVMLTQGAGIELDEPGDQFGAALAWGDFNGDGIDDLAIGIPGEDNAAGMGDVGAVAVLYGVFGVGLGPIVGPPFFAQPMMIGGDVDEAGDRFGAALAAGNFDGDPFDDLAVGAPGEDVGVMADAGWVQIAHGSPPGIFPGAPAPFPAFPQGLFGLDPIEPGDAFGGTMVTGDFNGDGADDLAISCEFEDIGAAVDCGGVTVGYGLVGAGIVPPGAEWWHQNTPGMSDTCEAGDRFGAALAALDFDMNLMEDLAIGVPGESLGANIATGIVAVIHGNPGAPGLDAFVPIVDQFWHQNQPSVPSANAPGDNFGEALAAGWTDGPFGFKYLAIGIPGKNIGVNADAGAVITLYSGLGGIGLSATLGVTAPEYWHQNTPGIGGSNAGGDMFGSALGVGDFDGNLVQDLVIGIPSDNIGAAGDCGSVDVIYGLLAPGLHLDAFGPVLSEFWHQNIAGVPDANEPGDAQGSAVDQK
ncbi:MAG: FG-GAP repeat protein [Phycisphaerales bacterium]|nr:FG-GAP repeat protein [Phycisphaerales bacterium]